MCGLQRKGCHYRHGVGEEMMNARVGKDNKGAVRQDAYAEHQGLMGGDRRDVRAGTAMQ